MGTFNLIAFGVFLGLFMLLGFVMMVTILPRSPKFWKATDYVWLAIASVGLVGAVRQYVYEMNREYADTYRNLTESRIGMMRSSLEREILNEKFALLHGEENALTKVHLSPKIKPTEDLRDTILWRQSVLNRLNARDGGD